MGRTDAPVLPITVDRSAHLPLPVQLAAGLREAVRSGLLAPGDRVPPSRSLAAQLGVSRGTVTSAYDQLTGEGYLISAHGSATIINPELGAIHPQVAFPAVAAFPGAEPVLALSGRRSLPAPDAAPVRRPIDLRPGRPDTRRLDDPSWRAAWRAAVSVSPEDELPPPAGLPILRAAIAEHLRLVRGLNRGPDEVLITAGAREGLALLLMSLRDPARRPLRVAVEDPGYPALRQVLRRIGAEVLPTPVDADGLVVAALETGADAADIVIVTPNHQYPLGGSMPVTRRMALLDWAAANRALIVEDDYDSEFRYVGSPLPALVSLDSSDRVVNLGTFSKVLTPRLASGYILAPVHLVETMARTRQELGAPVSGYVQHALAHYLDTGGLRRHIARVRRDYLHRRRMLIDILSGVDGLDVQQLDGGLHAVVTVSPPRNVDSILAVAAEHGVLVSDLDHYWTHESQSAKPGVLIGYGGVPDSDLRRGLDRLITAVAATDQEETFADQNR
ncbi:PLP-dependent aminotransferase family protein [Saxibacter everestensis]|uniref:PLP-dependent aminotransferase family protein n=1 Tax=Saxibacter everestensis TaxID=2909229 RepID=A0ABY8QX61_9MICO|nr:PLP-dependent aminotransferase family protein [Brevibacteriaceae bacterium ZFBP1038]